MTRRGLTKWLMTASTLKLYEQLRSRVKLKTGVVGAARGEADLQLTTSQIIPLLKLLFLVAGHSTMFPALHLSLPKS